MERQHKELLPKIDTLLKQLRSRLADAKQFESDVLKVQLWMKETEIATSETLNLDNATLSYLEQKLKKYEGLQNAASAFMSLLRDLEERGLKLKENLLKADQILLEQDLEILAQQMTR